MNARRKQINPWDGTHTFKVSLFGTDREGNLQFQSSRIIDDAALIDLYAEAEELVAPKTTAHDTPLKIQIAIKERWGDETHILDVEATDRTKREAIEAYKVWWEAERTRRSETIQANLKETRSQMLRWERKAEDTKQGFYLGSIYLGPSLFCVRRTLLSLGRDADQTIHDYRANKR